MGLLFTTNRTLTLRDTARRYRRYHSVHVYYTVIKLETVGNQAGMFYVTLPLPDQWYGVVF